MLEAGTQLMRLLLRPASTRVSVMMMCGQESGVSRGQRGTGVTRWDHREIVCPLTSGALSSRKDN